MDAIVGIFNEMGLDFWSLTKTAGVLLLGTLLISVIGRFIFGKRSALNNAVSSAIGIIFVYALTVVLKSFGTQFDAFLAPLPYATIANDHLILFSFADAEYTAICSQVLSMIILAFLMNLLDGWMPKGKKVIGWVFFRCVSVILALVLHLAVSWAFNTYLPEGIVTYAPVILLALLILMLLTGALKLLVGAVLTTVNPLVGALYTFFFANIVGKQITKAVLTTILLTLLVLALQYVGVGAIGIASGALVAYIPFIIVLVILWYIVRKVL